MPEGVCPVRGVEGASKQSEKRLSPRATAPEKSKTQPEPWVRRQLRGRIERHFGPSCLRHPCFQASGRPGVIANFAGLRDGVKKDQRSLPVTTSEGTMLAVASQEGFPDCVRPTIISLRKDGRRGTGENDGMLAAGRFAAEILAKGRFPALSPKSEKWVCRWRRQARKRKNSSRRRGCEAERGPELQIRRGGGSGVCFDAGSRLPEKFAGWRHRARKIFCGGDCP